jgi:hypothetical protein
MIIRSRIFFAIIIPFVCAIAFAGDIPVQNSNFESGSLSPWLETRSYGGHGKAPATISSGVQSAGRNGSLAYYAEAKIFVKQPSNGNCVTNDVFVQSVLRQTIQLGAPTTGDFNLGAWANGSGHIASGGTFRFRVGSDPTGGTDIDAPTVIWGDYQEQTGVFVRAQVRTGTITTDRLTIFLSGRASAEEELCQTTIIAQISAVMRFDDVRLADYVDSPPTVAISAPQQGAMLFQPFSVHYNVSDAEGLPVHCDLYVDVHRKEEIDNCPLGDHEYAGMTPGFGVHTIQVVVIDAWDNEAATPLTGIEVVSQRPYHIPFDHNDALGVGRRIKYAPDGTLYAIGGMDTTPADTLFVVKYDTKLAPIWTQSITAYQDTFSGPSDLLVTPDSKAIVACRGGIASAANQDMIVREYDPAGNLVWNFVYDGTPPGDPKPLADGASRLARSDDGSIYVAGWTAVKNSSTDRDLTVIKLDADGHQLWQRSFPSFPGYPDAPFAVRVGKDDNVIVAFNGADPYYYSEQFAVVCYSKDGDLLWSKVFNEEDEIREGAAMVIDPDGNIYVTAIWEVPGEAADVMTMKFSPTGDVLWSVLENGSANLLDEATDMAIGKSGNIYVIGYAQSDDPGNYIDSIVIKYDSDGNQVWFKQIEKPGNNECALTGILDEDENLYIAGDGPGNGAFVAKLDTNGNLLFWDSANDTVNSSCTWYSVAASPDHDLYVVGTCNSQYGYKMLAERYFFSGTQYYGHVDLADYVGDPSGLPARLTGKTGGALIDSTELSINVLSNYQGFLDAGEDVIFKGSHWLSKVASNAPTGSVQRLDWTLSVNGDATQDNRVDLRDLNSMMVNFGDAAPDDDIDGSGTVDLHDIDIVFINFGLSGEG